MNYFLVRVFRKLKLLQSFNFLVQRSINGSKVIIPVNNGYGQDNLSISELWMCVLMKKIIPLKQGVFIDIGVNVGQTLIKLRTVSSTMEYIGFEPNPLCVYYTGELIKANRYTNTTLLPVGLFTNDNVLQLNMYSEGDTDSAASLIDNFRPGEKVYRKIFVPVSRFQTVSPDLGISEIAIVKIDVEGAELEVLQSIEHALSEKRPFIFMEILPCYKESNTDRIKRQLALEALFMKLDYQIFRIIKSDSNNISELKELDTIGIHGDLNLCDYVIAPREFSELTKQLFRKV